MPRIPRQPTPVPTIHCPLCDNEEAPVTGSCCDEVCYRCYLNGNAGHVHCSGCGDAFDPCDCSVCSECGRSECCTTWGESNLICTRCNPEDGPILDYSCRNYPARQPYPPPYRPYLYLGVEAEVEVGACSGYDRYGAADRLKSKHGKDIIIKADSSLSQGFEMVTGPMGLEYHQKLWPELAKKAVEVGCRAWKYESTGLHVHLSRNFFTPLTLGKFVCFVNSERNKDHIVKLAGRESAHYAALKKKKLSSIYSDDRFEAVNLTNDDTIEVRIFKGTLKAEHILADIEFCHAVAYWVREQGIQDYEDWSAFTAWVRKNRKTYKYLSTYFKLRYFCYPKGKEVVTTGAAREAVLA